MRRIRSVVTILLTALVAVGLMTPSGAAAADPPPDTSTYYLALGDSLAYGEPTGVGYAEDLYKVLQLAHPGIKLIKLGCPRESTATMIRGGEPCAITGQYEQYGGATNQLDAAIWLLQKKKVGYLTIDIGPNDVLSCIKGLSIDAGCVLEGLATVKRNLPTIFGDLRSNLDGTTETAGMTFYNPFAALRPQAVAEQSLEFINTLNRTEIENYQQFGFTLAPVADVFQTNNSTINPFTQLPVNFTRICVLTLMCTAKPDIHPNQLGYWVIATTFAAAFHRG